ncbi:MAG: S8 family serine peptidase [Gammaproteobacteria bacterium]
MKRSFDSKNFATVILSLLLCSICHASEASDALSQASHSTIMSNADDTGKVSVIVKMKTNTSSAKLSASSMAIDSRKTRVVSKLRKLNSINVKKFQHLPITSAQVDSEGLNALLNNPDVAAVYEDKLFKPYLTASTSLIGSTTTLGSGAGGSGQLIAILDTGVDSDHPFLSGKVVHEACFSKTSGDSTSICPDGSNNQIGTGAAEPCINDCEHGTHVAGIAAGKGDSFSGVAPDANIMAIQVFSHFTGAYCNGASSCVLAYTSDILSGLEHVYSMKDTYNIASVNMSLGGGAYSSACDGSIYKSTIDLLKAADIATVIASGNDGYSSQVSSPACISTAITVGSTTKSDAISSFSNSADLLDILAPGSSIQSSIPGTSYGYMSGTSMATPHVAGAFAAIRSKYPTSSVDEILTALKNTGVSITDTRNNITRSRIQIDSALVELKPIKIRNDFSPDGKSDIHWRNNLTAERQVFHMNGSSVISSQIINDNKDLGSQIVGVGDFNGDNNADVVWRNNQNGSSTIDIMNGINITSSVSLNIQNDLSWSTVGIGDFDGNGNDDLLWKNTTTGEVRVSFMNGASLVSDQSVTTVGTAWDIKGVGDFDGDGKDDILWRHTANGRLWMHLLDGATITTSTHIAYTSLSWDIKKVGDFNGDGKYDILWKNSESGRVWTYIMNGTSIENGSISAPGEHIAFSALTWDIKTTSDFDGDGKDDILWRNDTTGENYMYLMNGSNIAAEQSVDALSDLHWTIEE